MVSIQPNKTIKKKCIEYKGIFYNNQTSSNQVYEGGAHFKYDLLYKLLEDLSKKQQSSHNPQHSQEDQPKPEISKSRNIDHTSHPNSQAKFNTHKNTIAPLFKIINMKKHKDVMINSIKINNNFLQLPHCETKNEQCVLSDKKPKVRHKPLSIEKDRTLSSSALCIHHQHHQFKSRPIAKISFSLSTFINGIKATSDNQSKNDLKSNRQRSYHTRNINALFGNMSASSDYHLSKEKVRHYTNRETSKHKEGARNIVRFASLNIKLPSEKGNHTNQPTSFRLQKSNSLLLKLNMKKDKDNKENHNDKMVALNTQLRMKRKNHNAIAFKMSKQC